VPAVVRHQRVPVQQAVGGFWTRALGVRIDRATLQLSVTDLQGRTILADGPHPVAFDGSRFTLTKALPLGERIYGLGDKTGNFDRREQSFVDWNTDAYGFNRATDPIYKSIPFYIATGAEGGAYGLFLDNSWRSWFDFGHRDPSAIEIGADGGPIDYYIVAGPSVRDVVRRYADLTGKAPLPPLWALGFQQSRYSYMSADEVRSIAARLRKERVPADVIWLDIDYQDRNRPFTTNDKTFPDLKKLAADVGEQGFRLVAITDLHVAYAPNQGYAPFDSGAAGEHFVKNADGSLYVAPVWPGPSVFPDFTRAATRAWWGSLYKDFAADGIAGFWNDMNEPAIFETPTKTMPPTVRHRIDSDDFARRTATHAEIHNIYGMENSRATHDGLLKLRPNLRPFVMTRASYAGGQRYAVTWTGDNSSTWDHLKLAVQQMLSLGLSGFSWSGADIPGFTGGASPELATRWYEIGAFTPVFRAHSAKDTPRAEPWADGAKHLAIRRRFIEERYRLMPYLYAVAEQSARTGDPVMRPTFYDYPAMEKAPCDQSMAFTLGADLLIAASPKPESPYPYDVCLPDEGWYDYWSGARLSGEKVSEMPRLDRLPVFVRPGAIIPSQPLVQSTAETPNGPLRLDVYPGDDCRGEIYLDDGVSIQGSSLRQSVTCTATAKGLSLHFGQRVGSYAPWWKSISVTVHGARALTMTIPDQPNAATVEISG
ncbi:TIM-barrel domain-containing protein, partial [Sphingomonas segetis]|uniref:TIM-barrel domain-containing protein n=1 Tax=Sphingomonas segetis TaxID=1104779 RepID=UPI0012D31CCD